jgi:hypothetical protein
MPKKVIEEKVREVVGTGGCAQEQKKTVIPRIASDLPDRMMSGESPGELIPFRAGQSDE